MNFAKSPIIGTLDAHFHFECPFVGGVSLHPVASSQIASWCVRVSDTAALTPTEAATALAGIMREATAELVAFGTGLTKRASDLKALVQDAAKLADMPADMANDRAVIAAYVEQARTLSAEQPPASRALKDADTLARWVDRTEGLDRAPILAAMSDHEKALTTIEKTRGIAAKAITDLEGALTRIDAPETAHRLAGLKFQRDLGRVLPGLIAEFSEAEAAATAAVARISTISAKLRELAQ